MSAIGPVAVDVTPLAGVPTGVSHFVSGLLDGFDHLDDPPELLPYALSRRARASELPKATRRLRVPAGIALRAWAWLGRPAWDGPLDRARVVHGTNFVAPPSRSKGLVITVHDCGFELHPELTDPRAVKYGRLVRRLAKRGAWIHTPSERVAAEVRDLYGTERVRSVPHGVPVVAASDRALLDECGVGAQTRFLLVLGALDRRKRPDLVVRAFGSIPDDPATNDLELVLAGPDGTAAGAVSREIEALPSDVAARVRRLGTVSEDLRATLLREATALIFIPVYEGFGLPVLEAMSVGTPVVATRDEAVVEVAGDSVQYTGSSLDEVTETIDAVMHDQLLRDRLATAGRDRAAEFDWAATAARIADLYAAATP